MFTISQIRAQARQTINSIPGIFYLPIIPVLLTLVITLIQYLFPDRSFLNSYDPAVSGSAMFSSFIFPILYNLLVTFISISLAWTLLQVIRGVKQIVEIKDALAIFNSPHLGKIFLTFFIKQVFLFLWGLLAAVGIALFLGAFIVVIAYAFLKNNFDPSTFPEDILAAFGMMMLLGFVLFIAGIILYIPQYLAYSQVEYILYDKLEKNEYFGATAVIRASRQMMKGYKGKRFVLDLSFIGWFLLQGITFGLAGIYVLPYYYAAQAHFYEAVKAETQMRQAAYFNQFNQVAGAPNPVASQTETIPDKDDENSSLAQVEHPDSAAETGNSAPDQPVESKMDAAIDSPIDHEE